MALVNADDQWRPSLPPIKTTASSASSYKETYHTIGEQPYSHVSNNYVKHRPPPAAASAPASSPFSPQTGCPNSSRPSDSPSSLYSNKFSCPHLLPNCFSCVRPRRTPTSPRCPRRHCTSTCMHRKRLYGSLAFLFPSAGRMQSFYSSTPTAKAQLSGTFPRTFSGKIEQYMSPRTPSATALTSQVSGKFSHISSPRTPASSKVQHFSGAIPSPRTPYGAASAATSPASARRKKPSFTLVMPPGMMDKKKAFEQIIDEPSSPHVTCIGRVRRQTHCKKLLRSDTIDLCNHRCQDTKAQKKGTTIMSSKHQSFPDPRRTHRSDSAHRSNVQNQNTESLVTEQPTMLEACTQRFGKQKLLNLHKIRGHGHETSHAYNEDGVHVVSQERHDKVEPALCKIKSDNPLVNVQNKSSINTECIPAVSSPSECSGEDAALAEIQTTSSCMVELLDGGGGGGGGGDQLRYAETHPQEQRCLLLMRSTGSRRLSEADRVSLASCIV